MTHYCTSIIKQRRFGRCMDFKMTSCAYYPVNTWSCLNVVTTLLKSKQRCINVKTTSCTYWAMTWRWKLRVKNPVRLAIVEPSNVKVLWYQIISRNVPSWMSRISGIFLMKWIKIRKFLKKTTESKATQVLEVYIISIAELMSELSQTEENQIFL